MKKCFLLLLISLFFLSGCSPKGTEQISVDHPYEIVKGMSTLSYYDTDDSINMNGFNVLENNLQNYQDKNNHIIVDDGIIRCIKVIDTSVKTYKAISVGDKVEKIEQSFNNESKMGDTYLVLFNNDTEEDPVNQNKEDTWIWITYYTDGSQIISIEILDVLYGRTFK